MLAAWSREWFPELILGAVASSAPVQQEVDNYGERLEWLGWVLITVDWVSDRMSWNKSELNVFHARPISRHLELWLIVFRLVFKKNSTIASNVDVLHLEVLIGHKKRDHLKLQNTTKIVIIYCLRIPRSRGRRGEETIAEVPRSNCRCIRTYERTDDEPGRKEEDPGNVQVRCLSDFKKKLLTFAREQQWKGVRDNYMMQFWQSRKELLIELALKM